MFSRNRFTTTKRQFLGWAVCSLLVASAAMTATAATQTYFITGEVTIGGPIPAGTPYTGTYTFDDATPDTNGDADQGDFATGEFFLDFGPAIGTIVFDQTGQLSVRNDEPGFGGFTIDDFFSIEAGVGARNTPGFSNDFEAVPPILLFRASEISPGIPTALSSDALSGVPHVAGSPWDPADQLIQFTLDAAAGGCPPFTSSCTIRLDVVSVAEAGTLTVTLDGDGSGAVVSDPAGIDCPGDCSEVLGGTVELTAVPDSGSELVGFTGCDSVTDNVCTVLVSSDMSVVATFALLPPPSGTLTVSIEGTGSGTVVSNPVGINCPGDCSELLSGSVELTATPGPDSTLVGFTGCDSVVGNVCTILVDSDAMVTATFALGVEAIPAAGPTALLLMALMMAIAGTIVIKRIL